MEQATVTGKKWLLYAMGGGFGHLHRAISLARAAARQGVAVHIVSNSPLADWLARPDWRPWVDLSPQITITRLAPRPTPAEAARAMAMLLSDAWDVLIVDTFARGLGGELVELLPEAPMKKVFVHRDLCEQYVRRYRLQSWIQQHYQLVVAPGERGPLAELAVWTAPWLLLEAEELLHASAAREQLGCDAARPVVAVTACGRGDEPQQLADQALHLSRQLGEQAQVRLVRLDDSGASIRGWPLLKMLNGVDVLVGAGGYNTVHEARATGVPLLALPQPRQYDRQHRRLQPNETTTPHELAEAVQDQLRAGRSTRRTSYVNGAAAAVGEIRALLEF